jgi:hypothetical protein
MIFQRAKKQEWSTLADDFRTFLPDSGAFTAPEFAQICPQAKEA